MRWLALLVVLVAVGACGSSGKTEKLPGTLLGPCYGNGTCNKGLLCLSGICVEPPDAWPTGTDSAIDGRDLGADGPPPDALTGEATPPDAPILDAPLVDVQQADSIAADIPQFDAPAADAPQSDTAAADGKLPDAPAADKAVLDLVPSDTSTPDSASDGGGGTIVKAVAAGGQSACVITTAGALKCWGMINGSTMPALVLGLSSGVTAATLGSNPPHYCAIKIGAALCWGGTTTTPTQITSLGTGVTAIATSGSHSCAVQSGALKCWGKNKYGQLGDGTTNSSTSPVQVKGLTSGVTAVTTTAMYTCAVHNGAAKCWGSDSYGGLGVGNIAEATPTLVVGLSSNVTDVKAGANHTCASHAGVVKCWGRNHEGQLGNGTLANAVTPVVVSGLSAAAVAIEADTDSSCAVLKGGSTYCWGSNKNGIVSPDAAVPQSSSPQAISGLTADVTQISFGTYGYSCVLQQGIAKCWGNISGPATDVPVLVKGLSSGVAAATAGMEHTCAVHSGAAKCWGQDYYITSSILPKQVSGLSSGVTMIRTKMGAEAGLICTIQGGNLKCWGTIGNKKVYTPTMAIGSGKVSITASGAVGMCAVDSGSLKCAYGSNAEETAIFPPIQVQGLTSNVTTVDVGHLYACAVHLGAVKCWSTVWWTWPSAPPAPKTVAGLASGVADVTAGYNFYCAIKAGGALSCWGKNDYGQLGIGTIVDSTVPKPVIGLASGVKAVSAGRRHACAITAAGGLMCWGANGDGQLGNGSKLNSANPKPVAGMSSGVTAVTAGFSHSCAIRNGALWCWGGNWAGQLGLGWKKGFVPKPTVVQGL